MFKVDVCLIEKNAIMELKKILTAFAAILFSINSFAANDIYFFKIGYDDMPHKLYGNFYKGADGSATPHYVSWNPIQTANPDFHCPEYFGTLVLEK